MPFLLGGFYRRTLMTHRGQPPVNRIVKCIFLHAPGNVGSGGLLQEYENNLPIDNIYFERDENITAYEPYTPPISRGWFVVLAERVVAPRQDHTDILLHPMGKTTVVRDIDTARAEFLRNNRNHRVISVTEFSHTIDNEFINSADLVDDF